MQFRNEYYFLSNMFPCTVVVDMNTLMAPREFKNMSMHFTCSESAFQAAKCKDLEEMVKFMTLDGYKAKRAGYKVALRPDWEKVKVMIMSNIIRQKFIQHPELMEKLRSIEGEICEDNTWNDTFWGVCNGKGRNELGIILMKIRDNGFS